MKGCLLPDIISSYFPPESYWNLDLLSFACIFLAFQVRVPSQSYYHMFTLLLRNLSHVWNCLLISCPLQSILLNFTILRFYYKEAGTNRLIPFLYKFISTFDLLCGIAGFFNAQYFSILKSKDLSDIICLPLGAGTASLTEKLFIIISYILTAYFSVTTAFLHTTLTVVRCISLSMPFYEMVIIPFYYCSFAKLPSQYCIFKS